VNAQTNETKATQRARALDDQGSQRLASEPRHIQNRLSGSYMNSRSFVVGWITRLAYNRACADAGVEGLTWRDLRATFGTRLGEAGYNAYDIADLMGHSDIRTTRRYVRTEPRKHEAV